MDFSEELTNFAARIEKLKDNINTEEATKTSIVLPFFQLLGYDVFNPLEFVPEYTADTGTKKGEKVDYAVMQNNEPIMIIEVKPINTDLSTKHLNQLFRYFTVTKARFGILTNGIVYKFYSDLEETNKMDLMPFLEINILQELKPKTLNELKKFQKECFNIKGILDSALELKYTSLLKNTIAEQLANPSDQFVRTLIKNIYSGTKTQSVIDKFRDLTIIAAKEYISDVLNDKIKTVLSSDAAPDLPPIAKEYEFLPEELETLNYVETLIGETGLASKKTSRYAYLYINSQNKWICRISVRQENNLFTLHKFDDTTYETEYYFDEVTQLEQISDLIVDTYNKCKNT